VHNEIGQFSFLGIFYTIGEHNDSKVGSWVGQFVSLSFFFHSCYVILIEHLCLYLGTKGIVVHFQNQLFWNLCQPTTSDSRSLYFALFGHQYTLNP